MKIKYFTGAQANAVSQDHQSLVGQPFGDADGAPTNRTISAVTVSPYSKILQWSFARLLAKGVSPIDALKQWPLNRFDVIVLSYNPANPADFLLKDLRSYLEETGQSFDSNRYRRSALQASMAHAS